ncbi:nicotinate phosphoribosyltransferase [Acidithiobacillus sp. M4-SHS-6]|uniref:nicotinate phosphoribosyltransferase n=1 Tax=Acidithiobacillus sp. M4-SHS-6 TaxID=3383024 RepID=UPI0039BECD2D
MSREFSWAEGPVTEEELCLVTDLYELTMLQTYFAEGENHPAVFEMFFRSLPPSRNFLVFAGLGTVLQYLSRLRFTPRILERLEQTGLFRPAFLAYLEHFHFAGDVWALAEGTPCFAREPVLQVHATLPEAQFIETLVLNQIHLQTLIASKAIRVVLAAQGRPVVDFGVRRAHGLDAGLKLARAAFIAGVESTSHVLAGLRYDIPLRGTMAHSAIQAFGDDLTAFRAFARSDPHTICLVDTFATMAGVEAVIRLRDELGEAFQVRGIRLDSGDLAGLSSTARARLDAAGLDQLILFASGNLDEYEIQRLLSRNAPIDGFGVGTRMDVSADAPALDCAYKLVEYGGEGRMKLSADKVGLPGAKQIFREGGKDGPAGGDCIGLRSEEGSGQALLRPVMRGGQVLPDVLPSLAETRDYCQSAVAALPGPLKDLAPAPPYPVRISPRLEDWQAEIAARIGKRIAAQR